MSSDDVPTSTVAAARYLVELFDVDKADRALNTYLDSDDSHEVYLLALDRRPDLEAKMVATVSLHLHENTVADNDIRVELIGAADRSIEEFANILATCSFNIFKSGFVASPGAVMMDVVSEYVPKTTTPHVLLTHPFLRDELGKAFVTEDDLEIHWLAAVPVTDEEVTYLEANGYDALEDRMAEGDLRFTDLFRESVV